VEVLEVTAGGCAEQAGMRAGDVLLTAGGAPVFTSRELWVMLRAKGAGGDLDFEYVRGREHIAGAGTLGVLKG
jgi:putative serine protease PepD